MVLETHKARTHGMTLKCRVDVDLWGNNDEMEQRWKLSWAIIPLRGCEHLTREVNAAAQREISIRSIPRIRELGDADISFLPKKTNIGTRVAWK